MISTIKNSSIYLHDFSSRLHNTQLPSYMCGYLHRALWSNAKALEQRFVLPWSFNVQRSMTIGENR